jgi:8-oxo-dGTP diphosphatase
VSERVFGERVAHVPYVLRPSAYGLIRGAGGAFALVKTVKGLFLPGGGTERGETPAACVARETREECGLVVRPSKEIAKAVQLVYDHDENVYYEKACSFWLADVLPGSVAPVEADHELVWLDAGEAGPRMAHESHGWALEIAARGVNG